ncbi:MAG TPA: enoyl-CoA hydratase/isomerase family protein [Geobacteraceae bacterium]
MPYKKLHIEIANGVGYIFMASGGRFNKLTINTLRELKRAFAELEALPEAVCIVITGHPGESFAVGADIGQMVKFGPTDAFAFSELGQSLFAAMEGCPKPVIGALNGITMGGGCDLALACDIRLAGEALVIAHPGAKLGIITGFCGTQKLPRLIGKNLAREVFMTADTYDAADALMMGLVDRVYGAHEFWSAVTAYAERIAANDPVSLAMAKRAINAAEDLDLKNGCTLEAAGFAALFATTLNREKIERIREGITDVFS